MSIHDLKDQSEVVMVSHLSSLDMHPVKVIVVTDFLSPGLGDLGVFPLVAASVVSVGVVVDFGKVFQDEGVDHDLFVCHVSRYLI